MGPADTGVETVERERPRGTAEGHATDAHRSGARPSECVILEVSSFDLPESGWGMVRIKEAWIGAGRRYDTPGNRKIGKPKTEVRAA